MSSQTNMRLNPRLKADSIEYASAKGLTLTGLVDRLLRGAVWGEEMPGPKDNGVPGFDPEEFERRLSRLEELAEGSTYA